MGKAISEAKAIDKKMHIIQAVEVLPCRERVREHILENIDRYVTASELIGPYRRVWLSLLCAGGRGNHHKRRKSVQVTLDLVAFCWKRGMPRELVCYPVAWEDPMAVKLLTAVAEMGKLGVARAIALETGLVVKPWEVAEWLRQPRKAPKEVREWISRYGGS